MISVKNFPAKAGSSTTNDHPGIVTSTIQKKDCPNMSLTSGAASSYKPPFIASTYAPIKQAHAISSNIVTTLNQYFHATQA